MLNHYTTKMTGPLETWIIHLSFLRFYTIIQGVYSFLYCQNPYSHMKCLFTKIQSNIAIWQYIAIYSNAIRSMALTRYCFTPNTCVLYVPSYVPHVYVYQFTGMCAYVCCVCMFRHMLTKKLMCRSL